MSGVAESPTRLIGIGDDLPHLTSPPKSSGRIAYDTYHQRALNTRQALDDREALSADRSPDPHLTKVSTRRSSPSVEMVIAPHSLVRQTRAFVVCSRASASGCGCPKGLSLATEITACRGFTLSKNPIEIGRASCREGVKI